MAAGTGDTPPPPVGYTDPPLPGVAAGSMTRRPPPTLISLGGISCYIQATAPTQPPAIPVNSLWINISNPNNVSLNVWNGLSWGVQAFAGGQIITAGTIAANLLVAGIVVAGIVNGTTITGSTFVVKNASGATLIQLDSAKDALFLYADTGSASQGALLSSMGASANSDPLDATSYPQGLFSQEITLANQAGTPAAFAGGGSLFADSHGKLRFLHSTGNNNWVQRSDPNITQVTIGNTTVANPISTSATYQANEGAQNSEYEIEIDGVLQTGTVTAVSISFAVAVDGAILGGQVTVGATYLVISSSFWYTLRGRLTILTTGVSGTCVLTTDGAMGKQGANAGASTSFPVTYSPMGATSGGTSKTFDTTSTHTITLYAQWAGTNASEVLTTYRTRITRRG